MLHTNVLAVGGDSKQHGAQPIAAVSRNSTLLPLDSKMFPRIRGREGVYVWSP
jgi:hypothetical protein